VIRNKGSSHRNVNELRLTAVIRAENGGPDRKAGLDSGLDSGLDFGLDSGLDFGLTFIDLK